MSCEVTPEKALHLARVVVRRHRAWLKRATAEDAVGECLLRYASGSERLNRSPLPTASTLRLFRKTVARFLHKETRVPIPAGLFLECSGTLPEEQDD